MLVFFGFTRCPDICPATLAVMTGALEQLADEAKGITPIFITVDPEHDTVDVMRAYARQFHPRLLALTGSREKIDALLKAYAAYAAPSPDPGRIVEHTSLLYLMGKDGRYLHHFQANVDVPTLARELRELR